jgi:hypothetical protein
MHRLRQQGDDTPVVRLARVFVLGGRKPSQATSNAVESGLVSPPKGDIFSRRGHSWSDALIQRYVRLGVK